MDKRISELRDRLWKKKAALQQKENLPVSIVTYTSHKKKTLNELTQNPLTYLLQYFEKAVLIALIVIVTFLQFVRSSLFISANK